MSICFQQFQKTHQANKPIPMLKIEQKMDALAREYRDTHDPEIPAEIYRLARQLKELDH